MRTIKKPKTPGMIGVSVSMPEALLLKIDELCEKEQRPRSNLITYILTQAIDKQDLVIRAPERISPPNK